jgi:hypothetical protein
MTRDGVKTPHGESALAQVQDPLCFGDERSGNQIWYENIHDGEYHAIQTT